MVKVCRSIDVENAQKIKNAQKRKIDITKETFVNVEWKTLPTMCRWMHVYDMQERLKT